MSNPTKSSALHGPNTTPVPRPVIMGGAPTIRRSTPQIVGGKGLCPRCFTNKVVNDSIFVWSICLNCGYNS